jgi:hypothetical protein
MWSDFRRDVFGDPYLVWHDGAVRPVHRRGWAVAAELLSKPFAGL